ncbi:hypoxanthine phosphoribosyltransferase, partial [Mammaliicoccus vitulinus]
MNDSIKSVVLSEEQIQERCKTLGKQITEDYNGKTPICVGILKGSIMFMADLVKYID